MSRIAYVNGAYVPMTDAVVNIEDRGYQFSDAVYEGFSILNGKVLDEAGHFRRLKRSLGELRIPEPMPESSMRAVLREVMRRNHVRDGFAYLQISRGVAPRDHGFPKHEIAPAVVMTARSVSRLNCDMIVAVIPATMNSDADRNTNHTTANTGCGWANTGAPPKSTT